VRLIPRDEGFFVLFNELAKRLKEAARLLNCLFAEPDRLDHYVAAINIDQAGWLADFVVSDLELGVPDRQEILETLDPLERLHKASMLLARELDVLELQNKIHSQVQTEVDKNQREYFLREQLKAIQKELGEADAQGLRLRRERRQADRSNGETTGNQAHREVSG